ncbi:Zinc finger, RING-type [Sesbania bispinosa]|nr:Zinc finger, RING-type [Sesbania bispinosa]
MVAGWRRAFCTSIPKDREPKVLTEKQQHCDNPTNQSPKISSKFGFFSNPSTPRCQSQPSRCGICMQSVKSGQGTAIFTAECSHTFHFPCIASHVKKHPIHLCPVCGTTWKELPVLAIHNEKKQLKKSTEENRDSRTFKVYNDDEPLMSPPSLPRFNPIPESENEDDEEENTEFQGFHVNPVTTVSSSPVIRKNLEVCLLPEAAIVAANRNYETYVVVLKLKPPISPRAARRAPVDLVTVLDVGGAMSGQKLRMMKSSMRLMISSLGPTDRLSIVAFSGGSKRLLPLRRMTSGGQRSARRIVDALAAIDQSREGTPAKNDALKKAAKVLEDRREKNAVASIIILSDIHDSRGAASYQKLSLVSSTRLPHLEIPIHTVRFPNEGECGNALSDDTLAKCMGGLLSVVARDVRIQLGVVSRCTRPVEIAAVYSLSGRPVALGSGSIEIGDLYAEEERELLVELKVPAASAESHHVLTVRSSYRDPLTREALNPVEQAMLVPRPHTVRSSCNKIERLRSLHVTARAVAESSRLIEHSDLSGAYHLLSSARALLLQSSKPAQEYLSWLEAEQAELQRRRQSQRNRNNCTEEKLEPLTPTSAWRAAERNLKGLYE